MNYSLTVDREKQYKTKIKLWDLRKNSNAREYSRVEKGIKSLSSGPLRSACKLRGKSPRAKKIRRCLRKDGNEGQTTTEGDVSSPAEYAGGHLTLSLRSDDEPINSPSPSITAETTPTPDERCSTNKLTRLFRELSEKEDRIVKLDLEKQATEHQIAELKQRIHSETATSKQSRTTAPGLQHSPSWVHASPRHITQHQPWSQPSYAYARGSQQAGEINNSAPAQQTARANAALPVTPSRNWAMTEANDNNQWPAKSTGDPPLPLYQQGQNHFNNTGFGQSPWDIQYTSMDYMRMMPLQPSLNQASGPLPLPGQHAFREATMDTGTATRTYPLANQTFYFGGTN